tara:strand:- start:3659 stop:4342 length:684 start_codon:yes stop_codon:yes gene_type:complete
MFKNNLNDSSSFSFSNKFKVAVIGDSNSGKTSSIRRISNYSNYAVNSSYIPTIGVDYNITSFRDKNEYYKISFWDLAGDKRFINILPTYYKDNDLIMIFLDCRKNVIHQANYWLDQLKKNMINTPPLLFILNKSDLLSSNYININDAVYTLDNYLDGNVYNYKIIHQNHFIKKSSSNFIEYILTSILLDNRLITIDLSDKITSQCSKSTQKVSRFECFTNFFSKLFK